MTDSAREPDTTGCALVVLNGLAWYGALAFHVLTIVVAAQAGGLRLAVPTALIPILSEIIWAVTITLHYGLLNPYNLLLLGLIFLFALRGYAFAAWVNQRFPPQP